MRPIAILRARNPAPPAPPLSYGPELVGNGTFATDTSGWAGISGGTLSNVSGRMRVTNGAATVGGGEQQVATEIGATYAYAMTGVTGSHAGRTRIGTASGATNIVNNSASGTFSGTFVATTASVFVWGGVASAVAGSFAEFDNFSLRKVL